jgi:hypothetical protein
MKPEMIDDEIGRHIAAAERSGELRAAPGYGQPMRNDSGWDDMPGDASMHRKDVLGEIDASEYVLDLGPIG